MTQNKKTKEIEDIIREFLDDIGLVYVVIDKQPRLKEIIEKWNLRLEAVNKLNRRNI